MEEGTFFKVPHTSFAIPQFARFSSLVCHTKSATLDVDGLFSNKSLRTFLFLGLFPHMRCRQVLSTTNLDLILQLKSLRVLKLAYSGLEELPDSIDSLKFLKLIDLSYTAVRKLPPSICSLYNLQRLKLKHCRNLTDLPKDTRDLINLCYLDTEISVLLNCSPPQIGKLRKLQVLSLFASGKMTGQKIAELKDMTSLRVQGISRLERVASAEDAREADLKNKKHLNELNLEWSQGTWDGSTDEVVLESLRPHVTLKSLSIYGYGGNCLPSWLRDLMSLQKLTLSDCGGLASLAETVLPPSLQSLTISLCPTLQKRSKRISALELVIVVSITATLCTEDGPDTEDNGKDEAGGNSSPLIRRLKTLCITWKGNLISHVPPSTLGAIFHSEIAGRVVHADTHTIVITRNAIRTHQIKLQMKIGTVNRILRRRPSLALGEKWKKQSTFLSPLSIFQQFYPFDENDSIFVEEVEFSASGFHSSPSRESGGGGVDDVAGDADAVGWKAEHSAEERKMMAVVLQPVVEVVLNNVTSAVKEEIKVIWGLFPYIPERQVILKTDLDQVLRLKCLRILKLEHSGLEELPDSIGSLKFLKFIDLSHTAIKMLPPSICCLYNLQRLKLKSCRKLAELPEDTRHLINLSCLDTESCYLLKHMPPQMGMLRRLQLLSLFVSGTDTGRRIAELKDMTSLRVLGISRLESVVTAEEAKEANLENKIHLNQLHLEWTWERGPGVGRDESNDKLVLESLSPHITLKSLTLCGYAGTSLPTWLRSLIYLQNLTLYGCRALASVEENVLPPSLQSLTISFCPILHKRCIRNGKDWSSISHVSRVCVNGEYVKFQAP
ncbi:hypothetical protein H6P81_016909 [Aristolochia fimbriata]|uniref:Uncharacterized protein n=1 Tax=Aristolochia fimbriata TaxID=158543 RepID=A0AAV7DYE7_ARIFI|nr:hypothetical protein H6P81_016909 [Aristolochia fimbriata]